MAHASSWCMRHRWVTASVAIAALSFAVAGASKLAVDPSPEAYLEGTPEWRFYEQVDREYGIGEMIVLCFREPGGAIFDVETVTAVAELDRILTDMPGIGRVVSVASATALARDGENIDVAPLSGKGPITRETAIRLGERIRNHPVYNQLLVDARHEATFLLVQLSPNTRDPIERLELVRKIRIELDRFQSQHRTVHLAGSAVTKEAIAAGVQHDTLIFFPAALALLTALLWFMFGDIVASLVPIAVVAYSSILVVGVLSFLNLPINMATATVPTMILVIGLPDCIHFMAELKYQFARTGDRKEAMVKTIEAVALPCLLTAATSAFGFFALASSRVAPLRQFGAATALGLMIEYAAEMLVMPLLLLALGYPKDQKKIFPAAPVLAKWLSKFAAFNYRHIVAFLGVTGFLLGISGAALTNIHMDSDFVRYMDEDHRMRRDLETIEASLGGADVVEVIVSGSGEGTFKDPKNLALLDALGKDLARIEGVSRVFSVADYLALAKQAVTGERASGSARLPDTPEAIAQLSLLDPDSLSGFTDPTLSRARVSMQVRSMSSEQVLELADEANGIAAARLEGTDLEAHLTGLPILFAKVVTNLVEDASGSFGLATLVIWVAMFIGLRSFTTSFASMIANVLTVGLTFATMAALGLRFDTNSAFVACLGIGITDDVTIHIAARYQRARAEGSPSPKAAIHYAITHVGHPVVLTTVLLAVGFSVLCLSTFQPTFRVGFLSVILVGYALLLDLVMLPTLLILADRLERRWDDRVRSSSSAPSRFRSLTSMLDNDPRQTPISE